MRENGRRHPAEHSSEQKPSAVPPRNYANSGRNTEPEVPGKRREKCPSCAPTGDIWGCAQGLSEVLVNLLEQVGWWLLRPSKIPEHRFTAPTSRIRTAWRAAPVCITGPCPPVHPSRWTRQSRSTFALPLLVLSPHASGLPSRVTNITGSSAASWFSRMFSFPSCWASSASPGNQEPRAPHWCPV